MLMHIYKLALPGKWQLHPFFFTSSKVELINILVSRLIITYHTCTAQTLISFRTLQGQSFGKFVVLFMLDSSVSLDDQQISF